MRNRPPIDLIGLAVITRRHQGVPVNDIHAEFGLSPRSQDRRIQNVESFLRANILERSTPRKLRSEPNPSLTQLSPLLKEIPEAVEPQAQKLQRAARIATAQEELDRKMMRIPLPVPRAAYEYMDKLDRAIGAHFSLYTQPTSQSELALRSGHGIAVVTSDCWTCNLRKLIHMPWFTLQYQLAWYKGSRVDLEQHSMIAWRDLDSSFLVIPTQSQFVDEIVFRGCSRGAKFGDVKTEAHWPGVFRRLARERGSIAFVPKEIIPGSDFASAPLEEEIHQHIEVVSFPDDLSIHRSFLEAVGEEVPVIH